MRQIGLIRRIDMLNITRDLNGSELKLGLEGRLDTVTAPELEEQIKSGLDSVETLIFDLSNLEYISSAGLRVLLSAQKIMNKQGKMIVKNVSEEVNEILEVTGFLDILTVE